MPQLQRYISKELTHFVGRKLPEEVQYLKLVEILKSRWLTHPPHNPNISGNLQVNTKARISANEMYVPQVICFCDIPVDDLSIHINKYSRFGISFPKSFLVQRGANPVFYIAKNSVVPILSNSFKNLKYSNATDIESLFDTVSRAEHFDRIMKEYHDLFNLFEELIQQRQSTPGVSGDLKRLFDLQRFLDRHIFSFLKVFDDAKSDESEENFYMEREWRMLGNLRFGLDDVYRIIVPKEYASRLREDVPKYVGQITFPT